MYYMKEYTKKIIVIIFFLCAPLSSFAMRVFFETTQASYGVGQEFMVHVYLDTSGQKINTISGEINLPLLNMELMDISTGNSSVLFWIERPEVVLERNGVVFSGITPGGISGSSLRLFSLRVRAMQEGQGFLNIDTVSALLHDGEGTAVDVSFDARPLLITDPADLQIIDNDTIFDMEPPEDFVPVVVQDSNLYGGDFVLVFATQDKLSGIAWYEIKEGLLGRFTLAESPYVLKDQTLSKKIFVRAVDMQGNERLVTVRAVNRQLFPYGILVVFSLVFFSVLFFVRRRKKIENSYYDNEA